MTNLLQATRGFLSKSLTWLRGPRLAALPAVAEWTRVDMENWMRYLTSQTGSRMVARLRATEARNAIDAAKDVMHTIHSAGCAKGYSDCLEHILSLARVCERPAQYDDPHIKTEEEEALELLNQA